MKVTNIETFNFKNAIRGMRNPLNSWGKSDSLFTNDFFEIGGKDLDLMKRLCKSSSADRKFLRQIFVTMDITAPLYWWKEMDTYKVGTTSNSQSTMHKLATTEITRDCFEIDDLNDDLRFKDGSPILVNIDVFLDSLEQIRRLYLDTKDKRYWKELVRWLPESWLQTRTWTANYEVLANIYQQRKNHKLSEWHTFCDYIKDLPYAKELIIGE